MVTWGDGEYKKTAGSCGGPGICVVCSANDLTANLILPAEREKND